MQERPLALTHLPLGKLKDLEATNQDGFTVLHLACKAGRLHAARAFIDAGSDVQAHAMVPTFETTPLDLALSIGDKELGLYLISKAISKDTWTPRPKPPAPASVPEINGVGGTPTEAHATVPSIMATSARDRALETLDDGSVNDLLTILKLVSLGNRPDANSDSKFQREQMEALGLFQDPQSDHPKLWTNRRTGSSQPSKVPTGVPWKGQRAVPAGHAPPPDLAQNFMWNSAGVPGYATTQTETVQAGATSRVKDGTKPFRTTQLAASLSAFSEACKLLSVRTRCRVLSALLIMTLECPG
jgi:hypothetical protein